jgi:hypothetical protein
MDHRNKLTHHDRWPEFRKYYRSEFGVGSLPENIFFKMIRTMVPRIYFRNPQVSITPRKGQQGQLDYAILARLLERLDNTLIDQMNLKFSMKRAIQDSIMFSTGILKLGYGAEYTPTPQTLGPTEAPESKKGMRFEYHDFVRPNAPWALRVPTDDFITPPGALDWPSSRWCAMRTRRHIDDVRDDPRFKNVKDLKPGSQIVPGDSRKPLEGMVDLWEFRDKKSQRVFVLAPYATEKVLYEEDDDLQKNNRLPYFPIQFNTDDEFFWGPSDAYIMAPHQIEINKVRTLLQRHRRISIVKFFVRNGALTPDELTKLNSEEVGAAINIDDEYTMNDVKQIEAADLPPGLLKMLAEEDQIVQEILGMGVNQFGEYAPGSADRSATEANIVNQATQIRTDERRDTVADAVVDLVTHMNHIILDRWGDQEQIVEILGQSDAQLWVQFKAQELVGLDYDVKVDPDSAIPETKQARQQKAAGVYKEFGQDPTLDHMKLVRWTLGEIGGSELTDLMAAQTPPGPAAPGATQQNPMQLQQLIQKVAQAHQNGQVQKRQMGPGAAG